jgi:phage terminase large subunit-like protein
LPNIVEGSQNPTWSTIVPFDWTDVDDAVFLAKGYGLQADPWQKEVLQIMLACNGSREKPKWASRQVCVSVPRQNGKNGAVEIRELFGLVELGERILHTAHTVSTARKAFLRMLHFLENDRFPELKSLVVHIRRANGQEAIKMANGGSIEFCARATNSGRGFSVDTIIFDEAQHISEEGHEALLPTISASPNAQTIYIGTPPGPMVKGDIFSRLRQAAKDRVNPQLSWLEWGVPEKGNHSLDDPKVWAVANPALGYRITVDAILAERAAFSDEGFERERLGVWHDYASRLTVLDMDKWNALADKRSGIESENDIVIAMDMTPHRDAVSVALCGKALRSKLPHCEVVPAPTMNRGTSWALPWVAERAKKWRATVVIDSASPASVYIEPLRQRGVKVLVTGMKEMGQACGLLWDTVESGNLRHYGQPGMDSALMGARRRDLGDGSWGWHRRKSELDISPLVSFTLAHYGWTIQRDTREFAGKRKTLVALT